MIGTITNVCAIIAGSLLGGALKKGVGEKYKNVMMDAMGLTAVCLGIKTAVEAMFHSKYHILFIVSLALGGLLGTRLKLSERFDKAVSKVSGGLNLAQGLSTAILLFCVGTLSILGPIQSALKGDDTFLFTNAMMDGITSIVLGSAFGPGIAFAAVVLFCWQGSIYMLARVIEPFITDPLMTEMSIVGGVLILSSGISILKIKELKTMNLLPALLIPPIAVTILSSLE